MSPMSRAAQRKIRTLRNRKCSVVASVRLGSHATTGRLHPTVQKVSPGTINKQLGAVQAIAGWGRHNGLVPERHSMDRSLQRNERLEEEQSQREPFDPRDLQTIFNAPLFTEHKLPVGTKGEAGIWLPLLALFAGARQNYRPRLSRRPRRSCGPHEVLSYQGSRRASLQQRVPAGCVDDSGERFEFRRQTLWSARCSNWNSKTCRWPRGHGRQARDHCRNRLCSRAAMMSRTATIAAHRPKPATPIMKNVASFIGQGPSRLWLKLTPVLYRIGGARWSKMTPGFCMIWLYSSGCCRAASISATISWSRRLASGSVASRSITRQGMSCS